MDDFGSGYSSLNYVCDYVSEKIPGVKVSRGQGTYMLYLDCSEWIKAHPECDMDELLRRGYRKGVIWQDGRGFKIDNTIRLNLALPHELVKQAMDRMDKYVFNA